MRGRLALTLLLLIAGAAAPAQAAFPGANGRVAFSSEGDLWTVAADGTGLARLTMTADDEAQAAFSPDGTRIAFRRRPEPGAPYQVHVMAADGSDVRRVGVSAFHDTQPAWTPDGARIVFRRSTPGAGDGDVWSMRADGTDARQLVATPEADERYPVVSPDGTRLAFTSDRAGQYEVYVSAADGAGPVRLTHDPGYDSAPSWSPDGGRIAFERGAALDADTTKDIWVMAADGAGQTRLTETAGVDEGPAFSPDGTQIAFTSGRDGQYEVYRMAADGSGQARVVAREATREESPDWQPVPVALGPPPAPGPVPPAPDPGQAVLGDRDRDGDGLGALRERMLGTSDLDRDSDDDGISDGGEVRRTRTRPDRRDTDRDGLTDGVERGVRRAVADPPGPVRGTARRRLRRDADPRTRTDPRRRDTDRDGRSDGREDRNRNGRVDRGETDPLRRRSR
ncbi:MAG TPA: hypothetical protein VD931_05560 [Baekduia sp.]|nr:hypothetical protein [Baekduia sp.]